MPKVGGVAFKRGALPSTPFFFYHVQMLGVKILQPASPIPTLMEDGRIVGVQLISEALRADVVVDATGRWRVLSRRPGLKWRQCGPRRQAWYGYAFGHVQIDDTPILTADRNGWTWIAKVRADLWSWTRLNFDGSRPASHWCPPELHSLRPHGTIHGADVTWQVAERPAGPDTSLRAMPPPSSTPHRRMAC